MSVKNICYCPNPPGGNIACAPHQMALCGIINGVTRQECLDPPANLSPFMLINWAVDQIKSKTTATDEIDLSTLQLLRDERYIRSDQIVVNFVLPASIKDAVNDVESFLNAALSQAQRQGKFDTR